jgi:aryl-alcohol dehydrogenase
LKIHAALSYGPDEPFLLGDAELDGPGPDEILVRLVACGICQTDVRMKQAWPADRLPMIFGHEGAGIVEEVGSQVEGLAVGDKVILTFQSCGRCRACELDRVAYCEKHRDLNFSGQRTNGSTATRRDGLPAYGSFFGQSSFASHALATERNAVKVPPDTKLELVAPLGCGIQTGAGTIMNVLRPSPGQSVVVFGAGGVGLAAVMAAAASEVSRIVVVEPVAERRALALELGASATIDPQAGDLVGQIRDMTDGGASHAFDTSGRADVMDAAVNALALDGVLALVASATPRLSVSAFALAGKSVRMVIEGDSAPARFIPELLELHRADRLPLEKIVRLYPHAQINEAVRDMADGVTVKPVLVY